jgi:hypothetical protein
MARTTRIAVAAALSLAASAALADVTLEHRIAVQGTGMMSAGNMTGTTRTTISGLHSRTDSDIQLQSRLVRMLAHRAVGPTAEIVLLDQDKIERLDLSRKQYTEQTFEELRAHLQKVLDKSKDKQEASQENQKPMDESKCEWLDPKADVHRTGEQATYAGYKAERVTIVVSQPCKDRQTGAICEVALSLDEWLAPGFTAAAEADEFHRAYAQKIGLDLAAGRGSASGSGDINQRAQAMFGRYQGIWSELVTKLQSLKGYPVKTSFAFALGGDECKHAPTQQPQGSDSGSGGGLPGQMAGKLGSLFQRKKDDAGANTDSTATTLPHPTDLPGGLVPLITMSSELVSVSTAAVSADLFTVPADFKKAE